MNEIFDVSFENCHENSFQDSFEDQSNSMQEGLHFELPCPGKQEIEYVENFHVFYDPVADYMDRFFSWGGWLYSHQKDKMHYYCFLPLCFYVLISLKHDEKVYLLDQLLDWIHWKSEFT